MATRNFNTGIIGASMRAFNEGRFSEAEKLLNEFETTSGAQFKLGGMGLQQGQLQLQRDRFGLEQQTTESSLQTAEQQREATQLDIDRVTRERDAEIARNAELTKQLEARGTTIPGRAATQERVTGEAGIAQAIATGKEAGIVTATAPQKEEAVRAGLKAETALAPGKVPAQKADLAATKAGTELTQAQVKTENALREFRRSLLEAQASKITDLEKFDPKLFTEQQIVNSKIHTLATLARNNPDIPIEILQGRVFDPSKQESLSTLKSRIQEAEIAKARMTKDEADGRSAMREMFSKMGRSDLAATVETETPETLIAAMDALIEDAKSDIFIMTGVEFGDTKSLLADPLPREQRQKEIDEARQIRSQRK